MSLQEKLIKFEVGEYAIRSERGLAVLLHNHFGSELQDGELNPQLAQDLQTLKTFVPRVNWTSEQLDKLWSDLSKFTQRETQIFWLIANGVADTHTIRNTLSNNGAPLSGRTIETHFSIFCLKSVETNISKRVHIPILVHEAYSSASRDNGSFFISRLQEARSKYN
jgi:hypothetical protein